MYICTLCIMVGNVEDFVFNYKIGKTGLVWSRYSWLNISEKKLSRIWCLSNSVKVLTSNYLEFSSEVGNAKKWPVILLSLDLLPASSINVENSHLALILGHFRLLLRPQQSLVVFTCPPSPPFKNIRIVTVAIIITIIIMGKLWLQKGKERWEALEYYKFLRRTPMPTENLRKVIKSEFLARGWTWVGF